MLLPIAYVAFCIMMNQKSLVGAEAPTGQRHLVWNVLMAIAALSATAAGISAVVKKTGSVGLMIVAAMIVLLLAVQVARRTPRPSPQATSTS